MKKNIITGFVLIAILLSGCSEGLLGSLDKLREQVAEENNGGKYTVTFDINGGAGTAPVPMMAAEGSTIQIPSGSGLTRNGYAFDGWNTQADGLGITYSVGASYTPAGSITLYARWMNTITFNGNGGTGSPPAPVTVPAGSSIILPGQETLASSGYLFDGWSTAAGSGTQYSAGASYITAGNTTLYARWSTSYTVTFDSNGGGGTPPAPQTAAPSSSITLPSGSGLIKTGYSFGAWNTQTDGLGTSYNAGTSYEVNGSITLYARWDSTVTYAANGASSGTPPAPQTAAPGASVTVQGQNTLARTNYTFDGWNFDTTGTGTNYTAGSSFTPTVDTTLYAKWVYEVTFNINGASTGSAPASLRANPQASAPDNSITLPDSTGFSRSGYTFDGWNTNSGGTGFNYTAGSSYTPTANITLYAKWTPNLTGAVAITGEAWIKGELTATISGSNAPGPFNYAWYNGSTSLQTGTDNKYTVTDTNQEQSITVTVTCTGYYGSITNTSAFVVPNRIGIKTQTELQSIQSNRNYILAVDQTLTISGTYSPRSYSGGTFDGNQKTIALGNLSYSNTSYYQMGLFTDIGNGGVVQNLKLTGSITITRDGNAINNIYVGAVAGLSNGLIQNVSSNVKITAKSDYNGASVEAGGIVGVANSGTIQFCYSTGEIRTEVGTYKYTGGIAGEERGSTIKYCWASGGVSGSTADAPGSYPGGIAGVQLSSTGTITNCVALHGSVHQGSLAGRITGMKNGTLDTNYANRNMIVGTLGSMSVTDPSSLNGADVLASEYQDSNWWVRTTDTGPRWASYWGNSETAPWKWDGVNNRPILWFETVINQ